MSDLKIPEGREAALAAAKAPKPQGPRKTYAAKQPGHDTCVRQALKYVQTTAGNKQTEINEPPLRITFNEGPNGDEFSTTDIEVQEFIEASPFFGTEFYMISDETPRDPKKGREPEYISGVASAKPAKG